MTKYIGGEFAYNNKVFLKLSKRKNFNNLNWITSGRAAFFNFLKYYKKKVLIKFIYQHIYVTV